MRHVTKLGGVFDRCPKAWLYDDARREVELISDVQMFREHQLTPHAGGLLDQPALWVEAVGVIDRELARLREAMSDGKK